MSVFSSSCLEKKYGMPAIILSGSRIFISDHKPYFPFSLVLDPFSYSFFPSTSRLMRLMCPLPEPLTSQPNSK
jgi:hypothetical protein